MRFRTLLAKDWRSGYNFQFHRFLVTFLGQGPECVRGQFPQPLPQVACGYGHIVLLKSSGTDAWLSQEAGFHYFGLTSSLSNRPYCPWAKQELVTRGFVPLTSLAFQALNRSPLQVVACGTNRDGQCDLPAPAEGTSYTQASLGLGIWAHLGDVNRVLQPPL